MLYGHIEQFWHRVDHMERLRQLQDKTGGFQTFIPLKFRNKENQMSHILSVLGHDFERHCTIIVGFRVDDIDGTLDDTTKIYSMAGAEEQKPGEGVNSPLNETGMAQAQAFFERYNTVPFDKIYTSTLLRTHQTVKGFIDQNLPWEQLVGLDEISWGKLRRKGADSRVIVGVFNNWLLHGATENWMSVFKMESLPRINGKASRLHWII
ncbi:histidine phosphatase superfamily (branch 1) domain-containing protein [Ditylenchus destructor]|uniref:Histidine phosphatase superfamily (Branch 1) domain-containing protein n=1 Tax=Ditylenchus destructor TaxID=166010 RepID=A0AAD4QUU2_9BILA|nr:histidine phosphatase superfamily (branch 1) domain-containing protein [Ditylenchus destructor]